MFDERGLIQEALKDLRDTDAMKMLMDIGDLDAAREAIKEQDKIIKLLTSLKK